jgi:hypothetical protein
MVGMRMGLECRGMGVKVWCTTEERNGREGECVVGWEISLSSFSLYPDMSGRI